MTNAVPSDATPLVSVILPTRNRSRLLTRAVRSVLAQSYANLELIVVNDASTDDTRQVLDAIADPRLRVIHREKNGGAAAARNLAIRAARGDWVGFQDDDDYWFLEKIEKQVAALREAPASVGWCLVGYIHFEGGRCRFIDREVYQRGCDFIANGGPDDNRYGWLATPGWLVRRQLLLDVGLFDERMRSWDDWELALRLSQATQRCHVNEPLFVQDQVLGGGLQRLERARVEDMKMILDKHPGTWAHSPALMSRHYLFIGKTLLFHGESREGRAWVRRALRGRPLSPRVWGLLLLSFTGTAALAGARRGWTRLVTLRGPG